jgi:hypothetical protein
MNNYIYTKLLPLLILAISIFIFYTLPISAVLQTNQTVTIEANILGFGDESEVPEVGIEVPDHISLGNVSKEDPLSDEKTIRINNTGKVNITVTPKLQDEDEEIFSHLYFRTMKSSTLHPELNIPYIIGEYSIDIEKPSSGNTKRSKDIYVRLNLTEFNGNLREDLIGYQKEIIFFAMAN